MCALTADALGLLSEVKNSILPICWFAIVAVSVSTNLNVLLEVLDPDMPVLSALSINAGCWIDPPLIVMDPVSKLP